MYVPLPKTAILTDFFAKTANLACSCGRSLRFLGDFLSDWRIGENAYLLINTNLNSIAKKTQRHTQY